MHERTEDSSESKEPLRQWRRLIFNRWLLAGAASIVLYALLGFLLAPWLVKYYVKNYAGEKLKRNVSIADVRINPFLFTFEAKGFTLREADNRPIIGFDRLFVDFELSSLFRWAWTFADIQINRPSLSMEIQPNGHLNLADLADSFPKSEKSSTKDRQLPRLLLQHAKIIDGSFTFSDRGVPTPATETFAPLNLEFKDISTLPERKGPYTISAKLPGGGSVGWRGDVFLNPLQSQGELSIVGFELLTAWKFAQDQLNLAGPKGVVDFKTRYQFSFQKHEPYLMLQDANLAIKQLALIEKSSRIPMLTLETVMAEHMRFDLQKHEITIPRITVQNGKITALMDENGILNWQKLIIPRESVKVTPSTPTASISNRHPWRLKTQGVKIENIAVNAVDRSRINPLNMTIDAVHVLLSASAEFGNVPVQANVSNLSVTLDRIALSNIQEHSSLVSLDKLKIEDGGIDMATRGIFIKSITTSGGETSIVRGKNGRIRLLELLAARDGSAGKPKAVETGEKEQAQKHPWSFRLNDFKINGFKMALKDRSFGPDVGYNLKDIGIGLKNVTNDQKTPIDFDVALKVVQGGSVRVSGQVSQAGDRAHARVKISNINLEPLQPVISRFTILSLESGHISASTQVNYHAEKSGPKFSAGGSMSVKKFKLNEADTGQRFLNWKALTASGITFKLSPLRLQVEDIKLLEPGAKIVIFKDRSINLAKVVKASETTDQKTHPVSKKDAPEKAEPHGKLFPVSIERVRVDNGAVDFADFSLVLPFATHVTDFNGGITGISSEAGNLAAVMFKGKVAEYGYSSVKGRLSPFSPKIFTDIAVSFRNVQMRPFSPYSATFAGRKISSGTLDLNLEYKIQNSELLGKNNIVLREFTLGERVKSPNAISLPLDLAIALLTDSEGKIDVAVPVRGNVDDPKFSYGSVIWKAITNLITKIVTAPFRALGHLFGGNGEQLAAIAFDPGSAHLLPPEMEKIKQVSEVLKKRPQLKLVVAGRFDLESDGKALRTDRVKRALAVQTGLKLAPGEEPGPLSFDTAKMQEALGKLLKKRWGEDGVSKFAAQYEKETGKKAKPMNFAMAIVGWKSSDTAFYKAMFNELVKLEPLSDKDLMELARKRAKEVVNQVKTAGQLDDTRVIAGNPGPVEKASGETVNIHLSLEVIKPAA